MPKIADLTGLPEVAEKKAKTKELPIVVVEGDTVLRYNNAADQKKNAEAVMKELRPELLEEGISFLFECNKGVPSDKERIQSVRLQYAVEGKPEQTQECMLSLADKVGKMNAKQVDAHFKALKANPNDYVEYAVEAQFDTSIFYDKDGNWDQKRFDKVEAALLKVAADLKLFQNPLTCGKQLRVKPSFFLARHTAFTPKQNIAMQDVIPCSASLEPVRAKEDGEQ